MNPESYDYAEEVTLIAYGKPPLSRPLGEAVGIAMEWRGPPRSSAVITFKDGTRKDAREIEEISQRKDYPKNV